METAEVEKSTGSEDTSHLNRSRSFKSKQLVRSQAIRETHSPPRALSPAQPASTNDNGTAAPTANNIAAAASAPNSVTVSTNSVAKQVNDERTVSVNDSEESSHVSVRCSDVVNSSEVKITDSDEFKKKLPIEIQITSGGWDEGQHERQRARRWHSDAPRDLLSNNPRVCCVCGTCAVCVHCRGRRRRHYCAMKQDSGIVCSDDCPDCSDYEGGSMNDNMRKSNSLDVDDQPFYCRCPERKERPKNISLSRYDSDERYEPTGPELVAFIKDTLNKNVRDRMALLKIERELHALVNDTGRCIVRFPVMTSYGRMLVHRCAALFHLAHHPDQANKTCVLVSKSGSSVGRIPCTSFKEWCTATFPPSPQRHQPEPPHAKSILKRDAHSLDEPGTGSLASNRSKSLEQRERDYERVRRRIFSSQEEAQWPWLTSGPIKLLTPEGGRNRLLKVSSLEGSAGPRAPVSKSHSFGGYAAAEPLAHAPRVLSRQGDLASSSWRLSPSSSGYKTLSLRSTDSITPSPTGGASPEPCPVAPGGAVTPGGGQAGAGQCGQAGAGLCGQAGAGAEPAAVVWAVTDMAAVPAGAVVIHPQTGRPLTNPDGSVYQFDPANPPVLYDPANPPVLYDPGIVQNDTQKLDPNNEKRRGRLEKQHSFIDNECECQPSEECRSKCCCECRRHDGCHRPTTEKETNTIPASPPQTNSETNTQTIAQETTNQQPAYEQTSNHKQDIQEIPTNQRPSYEATNHTPLEVQRSYEPTNHHVFNSFNNRPVQITNQEGHEMQYQHYTQGWTEEMTSPPQLANPYVSQEMNMQVMAQANLTPLPIPDPNIQPMSLTNMTNMSSMVYPTMTQGYPYQCRIEPSMQMYQQVVQAEEQKLAPSPHTNESAFRIDPSYPYAALEYPGPCGPCSACVDTAAMQHQQRSYSVPYGQVEVPQTVMPAYPVGNVLLQQPHVQPYPYQEQIPWLQPGGAPPAPKLVLPELYPVLQYQQPAYPHYNYVYPQQLVPQPYRACAPLYPLLDAPPEQRHTSFPPRPKRSSTCNTPHPDDKVPYDDSSRQNSDIAVKIQQIKSEMAQLNTRGGEGKDKRREDWRRRNSGNGLLGNCPVNAFNGRVMGRGTSEDGHLSSAARAIVNSIRNMQAKNTYQVPRRTEPRAAPPSGLNVPLYRQPYAYRQMSPGTWCRRSPAPVHPVLNHPRRPHPDSRNPRR